MNKNLLKVFGALFVIATVIYGSMILPPFLQEKQREHKQASYKRFWLAEGKKAEDEMLRQLEVEEKRINALPITRAEKISMKQQLFQKASNEMRVVQASDYKKPFTIKAP